MEVFWHGNNTKVIRLVVCRENILNIVGMTNSHWSFYKLLETKGSLMGGIACKSLPTPFYWQTLANLAAFIF